MYTIKKVSKCSSFYRNHALFPSNSKNWIYNLKAPKCVALDVLEFEGFNRSGGFWDFKDLTDLIGLMGLLNWMDFTYWTSLMDSSSLNVWKVWRNLRAKVVTRVVDRVAATCRLHKKSNYTSHTKYVAKKLSK